MKRVKKNYFNIIIIFVLFLLLITLICNTKNLNVNYKEGMSENSGTSAKTVSMSESARNDLNDNALAYTSKIQNKLEKKTISQHEKEDKMTNLQMEFFTGRDCSNYDHEEMVAGQNKMVSGLCNQRNNLESRNESVKKIKTN